MKKELIAACCLLASTASFATSNAAYFGFGLSNNFIANKYSNVLYTYDGTDYNFSKYESDTNTLGLSFDLGYWGSYHNKTRWGVKFLYQYLDSGTDYLLEDGGDIYSGADTYIPHEYALMGMIQTKVNNIAPYAGLGIAALPTTSILQNETSTNDFKRSTTLLGVIGAAGLTYNINKSWFLDIAYNFIQTGKKILNETQDSDAYNRSISASNQSIVATVNRTFSA